MTGHSVVRIGEETVQLLLRTSRTELFDSVEFYLKGIPEMTIYQWHW